MVKQRNYIFSHSYITENSTHIIICISFEWKILIFLLNIIELFKKKYNLFNIQVS